MSYLQSFFSSVIQLNLYWVVFIALIYILIHSYRNKPINQFFRYILKLHPRY